MNQQKPITTALVKACCRPMSGTCGPNRVKPLQATATPLAKPSVARRQSVRW